jgi:hypothetical protein
MLLRFLQASLLVPLYRRAAVSTRAVPIAFEEVSPVKRPKRKASPEQWRQYRQAVKHHNLSRSFVGMMGTLRQQLDQAGGVGKLLVVAGDGSFANRTCFAAQVERTDLIARTRKDGAVFSCSSRFASFLCSSQVSEQVRQDPAQPWRVVNCSTAASAVGCIKQLGPLHWQGGARKRSLRPLARRPPVSQRRSGRLYYHRPAYLLTTDLDSPARRLLQIYLDRWQIEVNHRDEKDTLGVGQAQLWNRTAVPKQPALAVAAYSALLLASLAAFGAERGRAYAPLPGWRRAAKRPSCLDLITLLRQEMVEHPRLLAPLDLPITHRSLTRAAAA